MALLFLFCAFQIFSVATADLGGILQIHYPNVSIEADTDGNITLQSGADASVYLLPGPGGSLYFEGNDILQLIKIVNSLPPVWKPHSHVGFFHTAFGGENVNVLLQAIDAENRTIDYSVVAGTMPPGLTIDNVHNRIQGVVPDRDALYSFTVRATNVDGKYADAVFRMEIIERNQCMPSSPCQHGGTCIDGTDDTAYTCVCPGQYSGQNCQIDCSISGLGVHSRTLVPDAMMSGYMTVSNYSASDGRYGTSGMGWCGKDANSWLQIDLGRTATVFGVKEQSYNSSYYTSNYELSYSLDGFNFNYTYQISNTTAHQVYTGTSSAASNTANLTVPITARFVRLHPITYSSSNFPCMRVDLLGCYDDNWPQSQSVTG